MRWSSAIATLACLPRILRKEAYAESAKVRGSTLGKRAMRFGAMASTFPLRGDRKEVAWKVDVGLGSPRARLMPQGFRRCFAYTSICDGSAFLSLPRSSRSVLSWSTSPLSLSPLRSSNQDFFPESSPRLDPKTAISQEIGDEAADLRSSLPNLERWAPNFPPKPNSKIFSSATNRSFAKRKCLGVYKA